MSLPYYLTTLAPPVDAAKRLSSTSGRISGALGLVGPLFQTNAFYRETPRTCESRSAGFAAGGVRIWLRWQGSGFKVRVYAGSRLWSQDKQQKGCIFGLAILKNSSK